MSWEALAVIIQSAVIAVVSLWGWLSWRDQKKRRRR